MRSTAKSRAFTCCVWLAGSACGSGSVGWDPCVEKRVPCTAQSLQGSQFEAPLPVLVGSAIVSDVQALEPTWDRLLPIATPEHERQYFPFRMLLTDAARRLYLAWVDAERTVRVTQLDDEGKLTGRSRIVDRPTAFQSSADAPVLHKKASKMRQTDAEPTFNVMWASSCYPRQTYGCEPGDERLIFASDLAEAPARFLLDANDDVFRDERGDFYALTASDNTDRSPSIEKLQQGTLEVEWAQTDLSDGERFRWINGVALGLGRSALMLSDLAFSKHTFLHVDAEGRCTPFGLTTYQPAEFNIALLSAQSKPVIALSTNSSITVERVSPAEHRLEDVRLFSADYASLDMLHAAVDPDGNVYVVTRSGGVEGVRPTLCRVARDAASCVSLPPYIDPSAKKEFVIDDVVARRAGVVFLRVGMHLVRLDYPI